MRLHNQIETISIAEPLQNRQHAQNPQCCRQYREQGKEGEVKKEVLEGRREGRWKEGGRKEGTERDGE